MPFNSYTFIIFFALVLAVHYSFISWEKKKKNLLLASYLFYAAWNPPFVLLLLASTLIDWFVARRMYVEKNRSKRKILLVISLFANLGMLSYFKYGNFILTNFILLLNLINVHFQPVRWDIVLPVGISFYTFQTLSYTIDIYRKEAKPWHSFIDYALFVTFFPQLVAGPIVRAFDFLPQLNKPKRPDTAQFGWGLSLMIIGLFQKMVIADFLLAPVSEQLFGNQAAPNCMSAWIGSLAFSGQIFADFSGYSSCAIGIAMCLGFELRTNFLYPYAAVGFSDFWKRWHISLSSWLRDYLYISLGGNRKGKFRTYINLMLTMLLGGLWHGASWTFVAWGGMHGFYLIMERVVCNLIPHFSFWKKTPVQVGLAILTFILTCFAWVFFRANTFTHAFIILKAMFGVSADPVIVNIESFNVILTFAVITSMLTIHWFMRDKSLKEIILKAPWHHRAVVYAFILLLIITSSGDDRAFIYFQF